MEGKIMNDSVKKEGMRKGERGNVLFLILIAVALFAALSYAVTQSTRSGAGDTAGETALINSSTLTQYPAAIRTSLVRMIVSRGTTADELAFNPPSDFGAGLAIDDTDAIPTDEESAVFHPAGGGSTYQQAASDVRSAGSSGTWHYNGNFEITRIGTSGAGGNEVMAFLPGLSLSVCRRLNQEYGIVAGTFTVADVPDVVIATDTDLLDDHLIGETLPTNDRDDIDNATNDLRGQPFGCFYDATSDVDGQANGDYIYYHVLLER